METANKNDFVELKFTGYVQGNIFDSNVEEDLKKINPEGKVKETIIVIGQEMVVPGLDKALEGKEIGKKYEVTLSANEGFGPRKREMVKTVPLKTFTEHKITPYPGLMLTLDNALVRISAVTGARVLVDFNNPLAGKELHYAFTITRKVTDDKEKAKALFEGFLRFVPEFDVAEKVVVKGPKFYESIVKAIGEKFKELMGKELAFELKELPKDEKNEVAKLDEKIESSVEEKKEETVHEHQA